MYEQILSQVQDEFDECVYCGEDLKDGIIETEDTVSENQLVSYLMLKY